MVVFQSLGALRGSCFNPEETSRSKGTETRILTQNKAAASMNALWKIEYLHQVLGSTGDVWRPLPNSLKEGEVVLVAHDREKRLNWEMGVVR